MITESESRLGSTMSKGFVVTIVLSFGIQAFFNSSRTSWI